MKKMFLIFALAFASFAGANAQEWSLTLGAGDGLPGDNVQKGASTVQVYKSEVITPSEPLTTLRFTVAQNYNGEKPSGNNFVTALSELVVYAADGTTVIPYTVTSNADHNSLSGNRDGAGLAALNDGNWNNYWHSNWSYNNAVADYHYLELTFETAVSEFILEWGARPGNPKNAPTLVGLTKGGVNYVPYSDWAFTVGEPITSMEALEGAQYFVMKSNVPVEYHVYVNNHNSPEGQFGDRLTKEPNIGPGPQYVAPSKVAEAPTFSHVIQLIPADGGYYFYYVTEGKYLSADPTVNAYNGANSVQGMTTKISDAAIVTITEDGNGRFELSYMMDYEGEEIEIHVGATPSSGGFRNVDKSRYDFYKEGHPYCLNYAYILTFDWTFEEVTMNYPAKYTSIPVRNAIKEAKSIYTFMDSVAVEGYEVAYEEFMDVLEECENNVANAAYTNVQNAFADVKALNYATGAYILSKIEWLKDVYLPEFAAEYKEKCTPMNTPQNGCYTQEAYDLYIEQNLIAGVAELYDEVNENPYAYISEMKTFINSVQDNVDMFKASLIDIFTLPKIYSSEDPHYTPLGVKNGSCWEWEQALNLEEPVDGIRLTFLETNVGNAGGDGKYNGYPMVALSGLEIKDGDGTKLVITTDLVSTNSLETSEGSIDYLFDDDTSTFYHSVWGNGRIDPLSYVYLDVKFPEGVSLKDFTIKTIGRENRSLSPGTVCITNYGEEYNSLIFRENPYNVAGATQITDEAQLKDGGLYIISGNLRVKTHGEAPRYYSGLKAYHANIKAALNDPCVYMFKKTENGWNIISLANAQYLALNKTGETTNASWSTGLTVYPANAAEVNFVKSGNLENTFAIYSNLEDNYVDAYWEGYDVTVEHAIVNANKFVFMDWDSGLAGRPCVSAIPGEFEHGLDVISASADAQQIIDYSTAGDYLHFNNANGEGEWNIYEVTMDDAYYLWANGIGETLSALGLIVGKDPGCISGDISAFEAAAEAVEAVVANEDKPGAQAAVEDFVANVGQVQNAERVKVVDGCRYAIESAYTEFYKQQGKIKAIYADADGLSWMDAPASYKENPQFVFQFKKYDGKTDPDGYGIPEAEVNNVFKIYNDEIGMYAGAGGGSTQVDMTDDFGAAIYVVKPLKANIYTIYAIGSDPLHTAGHMQGAGTGGTIVNWRGGAGSTSSWTLRFVDDADNAPIAREELIGLKDDLKALIEGFEGNQIITDAKNLVNQIEENIDSYMKPEIMDMISRVNATHQEVLNSVQLNVAGDMLLDITEETHTLTFELNNSITNFTAFQCNLFLPDGFRIVEYDEGDYDVELNRERVNSTHSIITEKKDDGSYLIVCYSAKNSLIKGESGALFSVNIEAEENVSVGDYAFECKNISLSTRDGVEFYVSDTNKAFSLLRYYDINNDGTVSEDDIEALAYYLIGKPTDSYNFNVYDVDRSGVIDMKDLQALTDIVQGRTDVAEDELYDTNINSRGFFAFLGEECSIPLDLEYSGEATAFAGGFRIDAALNVATDENGAYDIRLTERATESHRILVWENDNTRDFTFIVYSTENAPFNGNSGDIFNVYFDTENVTTNIYGEACLYVSAVCSPNGVYTETQSTLNYFNTYLYVPADANQDDIADAADLNCVVSALAGGNGYYSSFAADLNKDDNVSLIDVVAVADVINNGYVKREMPVVPDCDGLTLQPGAETASYDTKINLPLSINGVSEVTAVQFDLSISGKAFIGAIELAGATAGTHICKTRELNGYTRVIVYSENNEVIDGDFIELTINRNGVLGESTIAVSNIAAVTTDFSEYRNDATAETVVNFYKPGDANGDDKITVADIVATVNALLGGAQANFVFVAADMNCDGKISIGDVVLVVNRLLDGDEPVTPPSGSVNIGEDVEDAVTNAPMKRGLSALRVSDAVVENNEATIVVKLDEASLYTAMQFDVALPEGVSIKEITTSGKHTVAYNESRVVIYSLTNSVFSEDVMSITLDVVDAAQAGVIAFDNIIVSTPAFVERKLDAVSARLEGTTGIDAAECETVKVYAENDRIVVETVCDDVLEVISTNGVVYKAEITAGKNYVAIEHKGLYIIKVGDKLTKLIF